MSGTSARNLPDPDVCEQARISRDPRFDGLFFTAVSSTRIYCRSVCPVPMVKRDHVRYFATAAAAEEAGYRPCLRCRPELAPNAWRRGDAALERALSLIDRGFLVDRSLAALGQQVGLSERQLRRLFMERLGASPLRVYATRRLLFAKQLLTETRLPITRIALEAGFGSLRRFNTCFRDAYRLAPSKLRRRPGRAGHETLTLRLDYRPPYDFEAVLDRLRGRAVPGVETFDGSSYARTFGPAESPGWLRVSDGSSARHALKLTLHCPASARLLDVVTRVRRVLDLDADPLTIRQALSRDRMLRNRIDQHPGLRLPGPWDGLEEAVVVVLQQQGAPVSASAALVRALGHPLPSSFPSGLSHLFPTGTVLAQAGVRRLERLGLGHQAAAAISKVSRSAGTGELDFSTACTLEEFVERWVAVTDMDAGSAHVVALWALGHPDAFPAVHCPFGSGAAAESPACRDLEARARLWRPWRAYGLAYLLGPAGGRDGTPGRVAPVTLAENGQ